MRLLQLHTDFIEYEPISEELNDAEKDIDKANTRLENLIVVFVSVEKGDNKKTIEKAVDEIKNYAQNIKNDRLLIYPYAHLSSDLSSPKHAFEIIKELEINARKILKEVNRAPFGWTKSFNIKVKGHPLAENFKIISNNQLSFEKNKEEDNLKQNQYNVEPISSALKSEEQQQSSWFILDTNGELIPIQSFKTERNSTLKKFLEYETSKRRAVDEQPPHVKLMKKMAIADYEPASDAGNMRYYPKGRLMKSLIEQFVTRKVLEYGGIEVETPIMYDTKHPSMESYFNRFPARQYNLSSDNKQLFLRFAACFGQFLMAKDFQISYKSLPLRLYELTRYSFRKEKSGELVGLRRLRAFSMPDCHAFCKDIGQAKQELVRRFELSLDVISGIGLCPTEDLEMAIRFTEDFYQENKELIGELVSRYNKPVLVEMWKEKFFYFVLKWEFNFINNLGKASALSTDQIDVENAARYNIEFVDEDGSKKNPIILHNSPSGAVERVIYALLEKAAKISKSGGVPSLPLWLASTQVRLIPVNKEQHIDFCQRIADQLSESNKIRVDVDDRDESVAKKIRDSESEWIRYTLVIGDKEIKTQVFTIRDRDSRSIQVQMTLEELVAEIFYKMLDKSYLPLSLPRNISERPQIM